MRTRTFRKRAVVGCLMSLALLSLVPEVEAQNSPGPSFPVNVEVTGPDNNIVTQTTSFITRELRALQGVTIVDSKPDFSIKVIVLETKTVSDEVTGLAMSLVVLQTGFSLATLEEIWKAQGETLTESQKNLLRLTTEQFRFVGDELRFGSRGDLRRMCEELVARMDTDHFEPVRKAHQMMNIKR